MKTVLFTTPFAQWWGGGQASLLLLIEKLDRTRYRPVLLVPAEGEVARRARECGCEAVVLELPTLRAPWRIPGGARRLRRLLREESVSIIHAEQPRAVFYAALARRGLRIPLVWHIRTMVRDRLDPLLERAADRIVLVAEGLRSRFSPAARAKCVVVYNGVDPDPTAADAGTLPPRVSPLVVCAGRLERDKGQHLLVEAAARLSKEFPTLTLWLAGREEPAYGASVRAQAAPLGERVQFLGQREDARAVLGLADVVALPSAHEAFPRAVLEAMSAGKPVVASRVGGVPESVSDGETGLLVPPGDASALAEALRRLLRDPALREKMGAAAAARAARFSTGAMARGIEKLYSELEDE